MSTRIALLGDPHGCFDRVVGRLRELRPTHALCVGDWLPDQAPFEPIARIMKPLLMDGLDLRWVVGNHDCDRPEHWPVTVGSLGERIIDQRVEDIGGVRVAGLGGVFRGEIWYPRAADAAPVFGTREEYLATLGPHQRWRGGLPVRHRASIFPEDIERLCQQKADLLISHEAPSAYVNAKRGYTGWPVLDELGADLGVQVHVHGHHHRSYAKRAANGILVVGLGLAEVSLLDDVLAAGERDGRLPE